MNLDIISFAGQSVSTIVLNLIIFLFFRKFYGAKYKNIVICVAFFVIVCMIMIAINQLNILVLNITYGFVSFNVICVTLFNAKMKQSLLYNSLLIFLLFVSDIVTVFIWTIIQGEALQQILNDNILMLISNMLNILIMMFIYKIYAAIVCKKGIKSIRYQEALFLLFITAFEIYIIYNFTQMANNSNDGIIILIMIIGFISLNIYATYIIERVSSAYKFKYELSMIKHQNELQLANYTEMSKKYDKSRKVIHDIKKHLNILNELHGDNNEKANEYGDMIEKEVDSLFGGVQCSNQILSIVFSQKITLAESLDIEVNTEIEDISFDFMDNLDITALFANLWDNAIEACKNVDSERRFVCFEMKKINNFILINVKNSFDGIVKRHMGEILSTKENHTGVGLSIIKSTVEKYGGLHITTTDKLTFITEITIPINNK